MALAPYISYLNKRNQRIASTFRILIGHYLRKFFFNNHSNLASYQLSKILSKYLYKQDSHVHILDIGAARAPFFQSILQDYPGATLTALDQGRDNEQELQERNIQLVQFNLDNKQLPFKSSSIDCIVCSHVLEHLMDPFSVCSEFSRILKPSGICLIKVPNARIQKFSFYDDFTHKFPFTKRSVIGLLEASGFHVDVCISTTLLASSIGHRFSPRRCRKAFFAEGFLGAIFSLFDRRRSEILCIARI